MRYLSIDLGDKRTGLAVGDDVTGLVSPLAVVEAGRESEALQNALDRAIADHDPDCLVIGLPFNMDGTEGPRAVLTRAFGEALTARVGRPVAWQDERLTSMAANDALARSGHTHKQKRARRDALAAAAILRDYLEAHG